MGFAVLAGIFEVGGFVFFFRALNRGNLSVVAPIIGLEGGLAALIVFAFGERVGSSSEAGSRSRSAEAAWRPRPAGGAQPRARFRPSPPRSASR